MRETATIAQAFYQAAAAVPGLAKVEFITALTGPALAQPARTPLLLISPYALAAGSPRGRQGGRQMLLTTWLLTANRRGERDYATTLELLELLAAIDRAVVQKTWDLPIQPFRVQQRQVKTMDQNLGLIQTTYSTIIYDTLAVSRLVFYDANNIRQTVEFTHTPALLQSELIQDHHAYSRTLDGTLRSYRRAAKKRYDLRLVLIPTALKEQLLNLKNFHTSIDYYRDRDGALTMTCFWTNDFDFTEETPGYWTGRIVLEEI